jgi:hypothetical protein
MFWLFIAAIAVAGISAQFFKHRETQKTIRQAIDKGQALDADTLSQLVAATSPPVPNRRGLVFVGVLLLCIGVGIGLIGWFGSFDKPEMLHQGLGAASLVCLLGLPFLIAAWMAKPDGTGRK